MTQSPSLRLRDHGFTIGHLPTGPRNALTDVAGVRVGHATLRRGEGRLVAGQGPVRTGVTVILPHPGNVYREKVPAAVHTINGFGKACGFEEVRELGQMESPIGLTSTLNIWRVADALSTDAIRHNPEIAIRTSTVNVVVGETNDGYLNDGQGRHVGQAEVDAALDEARSSADFAPVVEGCVGAGTGTTCYGWKGGIGTASRVLPIDRGAEQGGWTVAALVQTNFGRAEELIFAGMPVGEWLRPPEQVQPSPPERGSVMVVLATNAPLDSRQLHRLCVRAGAGLARTGSHIGHGSGDFVIAFSTARRIHHWPQTLTETTPVLADEGRTMAALFPAIIEAVEEAVLNSLCAATTTVGRDGHVRHKLPIHTILQQQERSHAHQPSRS